VNQEGITMTSNIIGSPRTTLAGLLAVVVGGLGATFVPDLAAYLGAQPGVLWKLLGAALGLVGPALMADLKKKADELSPKAPPAAGFSIPSVLALVAILCSLAAFAAPRRAHAQDLGTVDSPLVLRLNTDWTLRPNVTVGPLVGYFWDVDSGKGAWKTNVSIGGLYVFDWREKVCVGAGATISVGSSKADTVLGGVAMVGGPVIRLMEGTGLRPALVGQYTAAGGSKTMAVLGTLSLSF
jgi:hypothetical protein